MANSARDRLYDWVGDFNIYVVPFEFFGSPVVNRIYLPRIAAFIRALAFAAGTDFTLTPFEPFDEPAIIEPGDPDFPDQFGPPGPQFNIPGVPRDAFTSRDPRCICFFIPGPGDRGLRTLPTTGTDVWMLLEWSSLLLVSGLGLLVVGRRRRAIAARE